MDGGAWWAAPTFFFFYPFCRKVVGERVIFICHCCWDWTFFICLITTGIPSSVNSILIFAHSLTSLLWFSCQSKRTLKRYESFVCHISRKCKYFSQLFFFLLSWPYTDFCFVLFCFKSQSDSNYSPVPPVWACFPWLNWRGLTKDLERPFQLILNLDLWIKVCGPDLKIVQFIFTFAWFMEKEMATHSRILAWKIPWIWEPGRLQFMGSQRVRHDQVTEHTPI